MCWEEFRWQQRKSNLSYLFDNPLRNNPQEHSPLWLMVDHAKKYLRVHINQLVANANARMIDIFEILISNSDLNNLIPISTGHVSHYNHVKMYQYVFRKNNLKIKQGVFVSVFRRIPVLFTFNKIWWRRQYHEFRFQPNDNEYEHYQ